MSTSKVASWLHGHGSSITTGAHAPAIAFLCHGLPVVRWKPPVLPIRVEEVRRTASTPVHSEQVWLHPSVYTALIYAYGEVTL